MKSTPVPHDSLRLYATIVITIFTWRPLTLLRSLSLMDAFKLILPPADDAFKSPESIIFWSLGPGKPILEEAETKLMSRETLVMVTITKCHCFHCITCLMSSATPSYISHTCLNYVLSKFPTFSIRAKFATLALLHSLL